MTFFNLRLTLVVLAVACVTIGCPDRQTKAQDQKSELGVRQKLIQIKMLEVEKKFRVIADRLREKEPKKADLLVEAYQKSKEELITDKMAEVSALLDANQLADAKLKLNEVNQSLDSLVGLLTQRKEKAISKEEEMEQLERWKKQIQQQINEQKKQRAETDKVGNKDQAAKNLEAQIQKLQGLIGKQQKLIAKTKENKGARFATSTASPINSSRSEKRPKI